MADDKLADASDGPASTADCAGGDCAEALHELYVYLDGELTDEKRAHIKAHLDDCSPCVDAYDFEAELRKVIAAKCQDSVPESLRARIFDQMQEMGRG